MAVRPPPHKTRKLANKTVGIFVGGAITALAGAAVTAFTGVLSDQFQPPPVTAQVIYEDVPCTAWLFDKPFREIPPVPGDGTIDSSWAVAAGGTADGQSDFTINIQGTRSAAVDLIDLRVVDVQRVPVSSGTLLADSGGCGEVPVRPYLVDLSRGRPVAQHVDGNGNPGGAPFAYRVADADLERLSLSAVVRANCTCVYTWRLAIDWVSESQHGTLIVDNHGRPFATASVSDLPLYLRGKRVR